MSLLTDGAESAEREDMLGFLVRGERVARGGGSDGKMLCTCGGDVLGCSRFVVKGRDTLGPGLNLPV